MKKILAIALIMVLMLTIFAACDGTANDDGGDNGSKSNSKKSNGEIGLEELEEIFDFNYDKNFLDNNLKGDFSLTYKMIVPPSEDSEGGETLMIMARTSEGYFSEFGYGNESSMKTLYLKDGDKYQSYMDWGDGEGFRSYGDPITKEDIEQGFAFIGALDAMNMYEGLLGIKFKKDGSETVAGRKCEKYSLSAVNEGVAYTLSYCFDNQTGVFMKSVISTAEGTMTQECTEFKTSGVSLPSLN